MSAGVRVVAQAETKEAGCSRSPLRVHGGQLKGVVAIGATHKPLHHTTIWHERGKSRRHKLVEYVGRPPIYWQVRERGVVGPRHVLWRREYERASEHRSIVAAAGGMCLRLRIVQKLAQRASVAERTAGGPAEVAGRERLGECILQSIMDGAVYICMRVPHIRVTRA
eukprot:scaffold201977_cov39-Tisochrysis_lutea.AAC.1